MSSKNPKFQISKSKSYEVLEHPADLKIRAYGRTLKEIFSNLLKGMFESTRPEIIEEEPIERAIEIKSQDLESLLVDFLSETLYLGDVGNEAYFEAEFAKLTKKELKAKIRGFKIRGAQTEIKAVTWHDLEIKKIDNRRRATVLFDI